MPSGRRQSQEDHQVLKILIYREIKVCPQTAIMLLFFTTGRRLFLLF